ncbi:unnamed protein product [Paramecium pentaurelia]|uniref:Uncharacterized protein n=1 Tax=Paramecium pentaurelia TaxID=43138 RepID=A0A8S1V6R1_9CILI|nr:unnamed protein product [Paramecium pentaurelia]
MKQVYLSSDQIIQLFGSGQLKYTEENEETESENVVLISQMEYQNLQKQLERKIDLKEDYNEQIKNLNIEIQKIQDELDLMKHQRELINSRDSLLHSLRQQFQEANQREHRTILELSKIKEQQLQLKQQFDFIQEKYNNLKKLNKLELDKKDKQIEQLKQSIYQLNMENDKIKQNRIIKKQITQISLKSNCNIALRKRTNQ